MELIRTTNIHRIEQYCSRNLEKNNWHAFKKLLTLMLLYVVALIVLFGIHT